MLELKLSEQKTLDEAAIFFQDPGVLMKGLNWVGLPIESAKNHLPEKVKLKIEQATEAAIRKALSVALTTLPDEMNNQQKSDGVASEWLHRGMATAAGAAGGLFGLAALPVELPVTTVLLLRGIADQARLHGHSLKDAEIQLECLMVFAMGSESEKDDALNSSYFASRVAFSQLIRQATAAAVGLSAKDLLRAIDQGTMPILVRILGKVAEAFQVRITQKAIIESLPVIGALGGGALNFAFSQYFITAAKYHFAVRKLEKIYGLEEVQAELRKRMTQSVERSL